ncbi:S41 family peptidase [Moraxella haemolytica]|uniref:S41 family peptidase n=1 Tax=Moraxella TaxID=475 RepID=UPI002543187A|nr:S41 family peptidase [Moraxella sp. ZY171148]WII94455.1 S41 family peptidase [Moraxella sp. ZY171148]
MQDFAMNKLVAAMALFLMVASPASAEVQWNKPIAKMASLLGINKPSDSIPTDPNSLPNTPVQDNLDGVQDAVELDALDSKPNVLHGIDGLHQGRVPLNAILPKTLKTFVSVVDLIRREYPEATTDDELFYHAINGMLTKIDSHAEFLDAKAFGSLQSFTTGKVADIGIEVSWQESVGHWVITQVASGSSADQANMAVGDYLHKIGEVRLSGSQSQNDVAQLLNGIQGTKVDVTFSKSGRSKLTKTIERTHSTESNIETLVKDGVVIVKLPVFQSNTREQILNGVAAVNVPVQGMIIDVRNNPGGVLESAVDVASLFMRNQIVTQVEGREGIERVMHTTGAPLLDEIPLIILQNRYSASAAEVLASSLKTQKRALIVGETSYGKGSVQSVVPIGDNQAVKITTAHYLTANGEKIDKVGVKADVGFDVNTSQSQNVHSSTDEWMDRALSLMQEGKLDSGVEFSPVGGF